VIVHPRPTVERIGFEVSVDPRNYRSFLHLPRYGV